MLSVKKPFTSAMNSSRIYRGVSKPPVDFLSRNKRVIKTKPPAKVPAKLTKQPTQTNARNTKQVAQCRQSKAQDVNTVVVSKSYLEDLLRLSVAPPQNIVKKDVRHVQMDSRQIPGLVSPSHTLTAPQPSQPHTHAVPQPHTHAAPHPHTQSYAVPPTLSAKEQWLKDLADQVKEKQSRQQQQKTKQRPAEEVYFPYGRPGCGAPMRTETGQVIADLRSRVRSSIDEPIQQMVSHQPLPINHRNVPMESKPVEDYFPYGRPGCGAPNSTATHGISYQPYGGDGPASNPPSYQPNSLTAYQPNNTAHVPPPMMNSYQPHQSYQPPAAKVYEDYYPYGRPGCGAPVTTHTHSQPPTHPSQKVPKVDEDYYPYGRPGCGAPVTTHTHSQLPPTQLSQDMPSPRDGFKRGAGPYVDKFVQHELDQRRRKELDYRAELAEQIAMKEREKLSIKRAKERAEAQEEARLEGERQRLKHQYQRDAIERRRKEELAMERHKLLQQGIEEAQQTALEAKMESKGPTHSHKRALKKRSEISSKFDSVKQSTANLQSPSTEKTSRIPVRRPTDSNDTPRRVPRMKPYANKASRTRAAVRAVSPPIPTLAKRMSHQPNQLTVEASAIPRPVSPPVPTLAKRMNHHSVLNIDALSKPNDNRPEMIVRSHSPPVPTLAKRQSHDLPRRSHDLANISHDKHPTRAQSPPVPTIAKKLTIPTNISIHSTQRPSQVATTSIPINRLPSCELIRHQPSPLPTLVPLLGDCHGDQKAVSGPSRQQVILEQLAALKKGIMSHQSTIDQRVHRIMTRAKPNF